MNNVALLPFICWCVFSYTYLAMKTHPFNPIVRSYRVARFFLWMCSPITIIMYWLLVLIVESSEET